MINLDGILFFLKNYERKDIAEKLSYLNLKENQKGTFSINLHDRERCLFILKAHESLAIKSGLERYGLQDTIDKIECMADEKIIIALYRDNFYHSEFYFDSSCKTLISIVLIKSRNKTKKEIEQDIIRANKNW